MIINHNLSGLTATNYLNVNSKNAASSMAKLSSGLRINKAADDAAGLSISQKMQSQVNGLNQATRNAQDGISLLQTAEGGLNETQSILQRMSELATQGANDTNVSADRTAIKNELTTLAGEINHISLSTTFNGTNLLHSDGSLTFQIGASSETFDQMTFDLGDVSISSTGLTVDITSGQISVDTADHAHASITIINDAIQAVSTARSQIGAYQNRLDHTINNLTTESQNMTTAQSNVTDVDMATEMMNYSKFNVLQQAAQSMLAQANQNPQQVLKLLQ